MHVQEGTIRQLPYQPLSGSYSILLPRHWEQLKLGEAAGWIRKKKKKQSRIKTSEENSPSSAN